jgi:hypothetical protein
LKLALESVIGDAGAGETLHDFAEKELAARREAHDLLLKSLLAGDIKPRVQVLEGDSVQPSRHTVSAVVEISLAGFEDSTNQTLTKLDPFGGATNTKPDDPFQAPTVPHRMQTFADDLALAPLPEPAAEPVPQVVHVLPASALLYEEETAAVNPMPSRSAEVLVRPVSLPFVRTQADPVPSRPVSDFTGPPLRPPRTRAFALGALLIALGAATYFLVHLVADGTIFSAKPSPAVAALHEPAAADVATEVPTQPAAAVEEKPAPQPAEAKAPIEEKPVAKPAEEPQLTRTESPPAGPPSTQPHSTQKRTSKRTHRTQPAAHDPPPPPAKRTIEKGLVTDW